MLRAALALVLVGGVAADDDALEVPPQGAPVPILYGESYSYSYEATPAPVLYSFSYAEDEYGPTASPTLVGGGLPFLIPGAPSAAPSYTFAPTLTGYPTASPTTPPSASPSYTFAPTLTGYPTASPTTPKPTVTGYPTLTGYPTGAPTSTSPPSDKTAPCTLCGACYNENGAPLCGFQIFYPTSMCAYSNGLDQTLWSCFENSTRAIDSSKSQPNRLSI